MDIDDKDITFTLEGEDTLDLSSLDTIDIPALTTADILSLSNTSPVWANMATMGTVSLTGSANNGWTSGPTVYTIGAGGSGGSGSYTYQNNIWQNHATSPAVKIQGDADIEGNLKVGGVNIVDMLAKIQERLLILVPNPDRLEKYEALKMAYEHYKTLEALCVEESNPPEKK
jgi:hypothetical protein